MSMWKAGLLAAVMAGAAGFGCGGVEPTADEVTSSGATERYLRALEDDNDDGHDQCGKPICETIYREKNITHVFFKFDDCKMKEGDFKVTVDGEDFTDRLKSKGGPCKELDADFRIEVPGPAKSVKVCVIFKKKFSKDFLIGSKAGGECSYKDKDDHDDLAALGYGGGGGHGGNGGGHGNGCGNDDGHGKECKPCKKDH